MKLTIGTRGSALALWQARHVASLITEHHPRIRVELMTIKTSGDKILDVPLAKIGTKGLFTKEIEEALLDERVDLAVHSMKDLPTELPKGLTLGAVLRREDPRDVFISADEKTLDQLDFDARIGTSSLRRKAFLMSRYPGLHIVSLRGNVDTRLRKIESENLAGVILAAAGVKRMGFADRITSYLPPDTMIPAIGQGALGVEVRIGDSAVEEISGQLNHEPTARCVRAERAFLRRMGGGCQVPMAAHAVVRNGTLAVSAAVVHVDGTPMLRETFSGATDDASLGVRLADALIERGADAIMKSIQGDYWEPGPGGL